MPLSDSRKKQLASVIKKMKANNEPNERIQQMVNTFKTKYGDYPGLQERMNQMGQELAETRAQRTEGAKRKAFSDMPITDRVLAGAGKTFMSTPGIKHAANLFVDAKGDEFKEFDTASKGNIAARTGEIAGDVALFSAPGAQIARAMKGVKMASPLAKAALTGTAEGVGSAALHQAQNIGQGKSLSGAQAASEVGASTLFPFAGKYLAKPLKEKAKQIIQTAVKSTRKIKGKNQMTKRQAERFLENYGSWRGLWQSQKNISDHHKQLNKQFDELINQTSKGKQVDILASINSAKNRVDRLAKTGNADLTEIAMMKDKIAQFEEVTENLLDKDGLVSFKIAQKFKQHTLDPKAKWDKPDKMGNVKVELKPEAEAARTTRAKLSRDMAKTEPKLKPLNQEFKKMAEIEPFVENALERASRNRGLSLQDLGTLSAGIGIGGGSAYLDRPEYAALGVLPFLISRGQKSPGFAKMLHDAGTSLDSPNVFRDLAKMAGRSTIFNE